MDPTGIRQGRGSRKRAVMYSVDNDVVASGSDGITVDKANPGTKVSPLMATEWFNLAEDVLTNAQSSVNVLNDLLNYDKIESGTLTLELTIIPIWEVIEGTVNEFKSPAAKKRIHVELELDGIKSPVMEQAQGPTSSAKALSADICDRKVIGDEVRLRQVIRNLISNAVKFVPEEGRLLVRAAWVRPSDCKDTNNGGLTKFELKNGVTESFLRTGYLRVSVKDTGAGMAQDQVPRLFNDGIQFNVNELQAGQGSELDLFISKGIVEQHSGTLEASSEGLGKGTTFTMTIPLYHVPENEGSKPEEKEGSKPEESYTNDGTLKRQGESFAGLASQHILVVDYSMTNRKLLGRLLKHHGHVCEEAEHGEVAVAMVTYAVERGDPFDTVLLNYEMPVMNGPRAADEMRARGSHVFIVGITGNLLPEDVDFFQSCGANAVSVLPLFQKIAV
jgi:CheY-like chemotaxis protein